MFIYLFCFVDLKAFHVFNISYEKFRCGVAPHPADTASSGIRVCRVIVWMLGRLGSWDPRVLYNSYIIVLCWIAGSSERSSDS